MSLKEQGKLVDIVGVCDVWDGNTTLGRGLYPTAARCGLSPADKERVTKDYRHLLDSKDVDAVMIATPGRTGPPLRDDPKPKGTRHVVTDPPKGVDADTRALWEHFLDCTRSRNPDTLCPPELGQAGVVTATMGVQSYRDGKALFFDKGTGKLAESDPSWIARWEDRSRRHGKPDQVPGWHAGDEGSLLHTFDYQTLEGDWIDGKDPASKA